MKRLCQDGDDRPCETLRVNRQELMKALTIVKFSLLNREFIFAQGHVFAFSNELGISAPVAGLTAEGIMRKRELYRVLTDGGEDEITLSLEPLRADIKSRLLQTGKHASWKLLPPGFRAALKFATATCCYPGMEALGCIHVRADGCIESSDNYSITRYYIPKMPVQTFLLPGPSARCVIKHPVTQIAEGEGWIHFKTEAGIAFECRSFEGSFPAVDKYFTAKGITWRLPERPWDRVIPKHHEAAITIGHVATIKYLKITGPNWEQVSVVRRDSNNTEKVQIE
jgi:hypothetical protein